MDGDSAFCGNCGNKIEPEESAEQAYTVMETESNIEWQINPQPSTKVKNKAGISIVIVVLLAVGGYFIWQEVNGQKSIKPPITGSGVIPDPTAQTLVIRNQTARSRIVYLESALMLYSFVMGRFPTTTEGLQALVRNPAGTSSWNGPYIEEGVPLDPWGRAYVYKNPGNNNKYDLCSAGADGIEGTSDDICNLK